LTNETVLEVRDLCKYFGSVKAVDCMNLSFKRGEVHAIVGENGSGKSTIAYVIAGIIKATSGEIFLDGERLEDADVFDMSARGVGMLVQEQRTINDMSIMENLFMGRETMFSRYHLVNQRRIREEAQKVLGFVQLGHLDLSLPMKRLSFEVRKLIEVGIAFYNNPRILILDETTTALSLHGREILYQYIEQYRAAGKTVILISHILEEVNRFSDRVTVMRDGKCVGTLKKEEGNITEDNIRHMMIGRELSGHYYRSDSRDTSQNDVVLDVQNISYRNVLKNISFQLRRGEILGFGGLTDCGMHELCKIIFGAVAPDTGTVTLTASGKRLQNTGGAVAEKMAYLSKNRDQESLLLSASIRDNIFLTAARTASRNGLITGRQQKNVAEEQMRSLNIKARSLWQLCCELSGGNKQKVVVAKWLANDSEILIMDCPTRGIDVGVKASIYKIMSELAERGKSIIMVSEELQELIGMADRILVMRDGKITGEMHRDEHISEARLIEKMV
jgi:ribose transport system ATP-binding protein